jgi:magnesium transporter
MLGFVGSTQVVATRKERLEQAIKDRDFQKVRDILVKIRPNRVADDIAKMAPKDMAILFRLLPRETAATTFEYLPLEEQQGLLKAMAQEEVAAILNDMAPDDRTTLLEELPGNVTKQLITLLSPQERTLSMRLLNYPEKSVGRLMTPLYVSVHPAWTVAQVMEHIRKVGQDSETLDMVYVVDDKGMLADDIEIRTLLLSAPETVVSTVMDNAFISLKATDNQERSIRTFRQNNLNALPVTDTDGVLVGIVTIDDILEIAQEEATEDIQKIGGTEALDEPYMKISLFKMVKKRASWLVILFLGEMLTATAMGYFEHEIAKAVVLALFVPLIISSGGNSGSQAATLVIRAMALGEVRLLDWWRVMRREILSGAFLGLILGAIGFLRISVWSMFSDIYGPHWLGVAITVALSLMGIVLWGTLAGSMLPLALRRVGLDPATSSAPFVATLVDVTGLIIYFGVAAIILRGTLL